MKQSKSRLRQEIRRTEQARAAHVRKILDSRGPLRPGCLVTVLRKCGKPTCRCATGEGHPAKYLSVSEGGKTRMIYLSSSVEARVTEQAQRYRRFRQQRATLAKLGRRSLELIDELQRALETERKVSGKRSGRGGKRPATQRKS